MKGKLFEGIPLTSPIDNRELKHSIKPVSGIDVDLRHMIDTERVRNLMQEHLSRIIAAKEEILKKLAAQIEGRPAELSDAANFSIQRDARNFDAGKDRERLFYKGVLVGAIDYDFRNCTLTFTPSVRVDVITNY